MPSTTTNEFGLLLFGTARAWRTKLDKRLRPLGFSQGKWRTLIHLSLAGNKLTQKEIAERMGIEGPTLAGLLDRLRPTAGSSGGGHRTIAGARSSTCSAARRRSWKGFSTPLMSCAMS